MKMKIQMYETEQLKHQEEERLGREKGECKLSISGSLRKFAYNWSTIFSAIGATLLRNIKENYLIFGITSFSNSQAINPL